MKGTILILMSCLFSLGMDSWLVNWPGSADLFLVNPMSFDQTVKIRFFNVDGSPLQDQSIALPSRSRSIVSPGLPNNVNIRMMSPGIIHLDSIVEQNQSYYEQTGTRELRTPLFFPHIAEQTEYWETRGSILSPSICKFYLENSQEKRLLPAAPRFSSLALNLEGYLPSGEPIESGHAWRRIRTEQAGTAGFFSFFNQSGTQAACLPIHYVTDTYLIIPHIPNDRATWWTGLVFLNPGLNPADLEILWHKDDGSSFETEISISAGEKKSGLIESFLPSGSADWAEIRSSQPLLGFELFGTRNEQSLCGIPLTNQISKRHIFSRIGFGNTWSGISIVNPGSDSMDLAFNQYSDSGVLIRTDTITLKPKARTRFVPESAFPVQEPSKSWPELISNRGFFAFQLIGNMDQTGLAALSGLACDQSRLGLALSQTFEEQAGTVVRNFRYKDVDHDGNPDLVTSTVESIEILSQLETYPQKKIFLYEDFGFEPEGPVPPPISVVDLNQDGQNEILILDPKLHIFTLLDSNELIRFQDQLPLLEGADKISGYSDTNRDGYLDILTGRGFYKSFATLKNPYFTNYFPYQLQTSGKASQFFDLNGDGVEDLLTSLLTGLYGFLSYGSTTNIETPLYIPRENEVILDLFQKDMDGDGQKDVIILLGKNTNNKYGTRFHIAKIGWSQSTFLAEFPIPDDLGVGSLSQVETSSQDVLEGHALLKQDLNSCTRFIDMTLSGIESIYYQSSDGEFVDYNGDGLNDLVAPWGLGLTEPTLRKNNPAFLFFDENISSYSAGLFRSPQNSFWVSYRELIPHSSAKIQIWQEKGFHRHMEKVHDLNLPIAFPSFLKMEDFDSDGDQDLLVAGSGLTVYKQNPSGFEVTPTYLHPSSVFTILKARECELNGNEYPDLIGNHISGNGNLQIVFDYTSEAPKSLTILELVEPKDIQFCDLDGDGMLDLLIQKPGKSPRAKINTGQNNFVDLAIPSEFRAMATMDINGSGEKDIIAFLNFTELGATYFRIYRNDGGGQFRYSLIQQIYPREPYRALLAMDVNQDGREDLLGFNNSNQPTMDIWLNQWEETSPQPFAFLESVAIYGTPQVSLWDRDSDHNRDLEFEYNGVLTWRLNKTSYFEQLLISSLNK